VFRLSRDVRFAIDPRDAPQGPVAGVNGYAGKPPVTGIGQCYYRLTVTLAGEPAADTGYVMNIRTIDEAVRDRALPLVRQAVRDARTADVAGGGLVRDCFRTLHEAFRPQRLDALELHLSPYTSLTSAGPDESAMVLLHHTFEFAASHRLHNPAFSDAQNREAFGKCNNPHGHGHNYVLRVTLRGEPGADGRVMSIPDLERIVEERVIEPFDHRHLNMEVPEFAELNPSVENIARVVYEKLERPLADVGGTLDSVTVWETPKTCCEYRPDRP
jgi:6-pyruvoyltetrahydropterin/6-carboxytetrahydropterin synthase